MCKLQCAKFNVQTYLLLTILYLQYANCNLLYTSCFLLPPTYFLLALPFLLLLLILVWKIEEDFPHTLITNCNSQTVFDTFLVQTGSSMLRRGLTGQTGVVVLKKANLARFEVQETPCTFNCRYCDHWTRLSLQSNYIC